MGDSRGRVCIHSNGTDGIHAGRLDDCLFDGVVQALLADEIFFCCKGWGSPTRAWGFRQVEQNRVPPDFSVKLRSRGETCLELWQ